MYASEELISTKQEMVDVARYSHPDTLISEVTLFL